MPTECECDDASSPDHHHPSKDGLLATLKIRGRFKRIKPNLFAPPWLHILDKSITEEALAEKEEEEHADELLGEDAELLMKYSVEVAVENVDDLHEELDTHIKIVHVEEDALLVRTSPDLLEASDGKPPASRPSTRSNQTKQSLDLLGTIFHLTFVVFVTSICKSVKN